MLRPLLVAEDITQMAYSMGEIGGDERFGLKGGASGSDGGENAAQRDGQRYPQVLS